MYEKYVSDELSAEEIINRVEAATPPSSPPAGPCPPQVRKQITRAKIFLPNDEKKRLTFAHSSRVIKIRPDVPTWALSAGFS